MTTFETEFRPPRASSNYDPIKLAGAGTVTLEEQRVCFAGWLGTARKGGAAMTIGLIVSIVVCCVLGILVSMDVGIDLGDAASIGGVLVPAAMFVAFRSRTVDPQPFELALDWENLDKVVYDSDSQCLVVVLKGGFPSRAIYIASPADSPLQTALQSRVA